MDSTVPALYNLPPELAHHVLRHLSKREKQQFALCSKHTYLCALAAVRSLVLGHKCLSAGNSGKLKLVRAHTLFCAAGLPWRAQRRQQPLPGSLDPSCADHLLLLSCR